MQCTRYTSAQQDELSLLALQQKTVVWHFDSIFSNKSCYYDVGFVRNFTRYSLHSTKKMI